MTLIRIMLIVAQLLIAVTTDVYCFKVKNKINLTFASIGILYNIFYRNADSLYMYFLGLIVPFIVLFPLYALNLLGAGDIKLFCSLGALMGLKDILYSIALSFLSGLLIGLLIMAIRRNFQTRLKILFLYLKNCFLTMSILPYKETSKLSKGRMHFTIPIAVGTLLTGLH